MATVRRSSSRARSAVFAPIGDEGRAVRVQHRLAEAIQAGLLADGERLPSEPELAQMLGVSVVTAREALVSLRSQGLVTTVRGRNGGSFVTHPATGDRVSARLAGMSRLELRDRGSAYRVVLTGCAELAAERATPEEAEELGELVLPATEPDVGRWRRMHSEFCLALAALTQSARLTREVVRQEAEFGTLLRLPLADEVHRGETHASQLDLVAAITAADPATARDAVRRHLESALERLADLHAGLR